MTSIIDLVARFRPHMDRESEQAWFRTLVPWVAPEAYLNIIFKPADEATLASVATELQLPGAVIDLLRQHNGAHLFSGALNIFGVTPAGQLLNRRDPYSLPPFSIERENKPWRLQPDPQYLVVAAYGFDGAMVCAQRSDSRVFLFRKGDRVPVASWDGLDSWIVSECNRLSTLFEDDGHLLRARSETAYPG